MDIEKRLSESLKVVATKPTGVKVAATKSINVLDKDILCEQYGKEKVTLFANVLNSYWRQNNLGEVNGASLYNALKSSLSTGLLVDGVNATVLNKGKRAVFIAGIEGIKQLIYKKYNVGIIPSIYYPPQIALANKLPKFKEELPWGDVKILDYMTRENANNPAVIQVGLSEDFYENFTKTLLDQKTEDVQRLNNPCSPWKKYKLEMYKKTAIKAFCKNLDFADILPHLYNEIEDNSL